MTLATILDGATIEQVLIGGDLAKLTADQRLAYYRAVCESVGLNPLTRPLEYITLNGRLTLYARRDATEQLRKIHDVSITKLERDRHGDLYVVTAYAVNKVGRMDVSTGAVTLKGLTGEALANALMKAETKSKRRVTLSLCGLGLLDESEVADVPPPAPEISTGFPQPDAQAEPASVPAPTPAPAKRGRPVSTRDEHEPISRPMQKKLFALATEKHWSTDQLRALLLDAFGTEHSGEIRRGDFDQLLALVRRGPSADNRYPAITDDVVPF